MIPTWLRRFRRAANLETHRQQRRGRGPAMTIIQALEERTLLSNISIDDVAVTESDTGSTALVFTVSRDEIVDDEEVSIETVDGTATGAVDYVSVPLTRLAFSAGGELTQSVTVDVIGDEIVEGSEIFSAVLSGAINLSGGVTTIVDDVGLGTIVDDDPAGYTVTQTDGSTDIAEAGPMDAFDVVLDNQPLTDVVITIVNSDPGNVTTSAATLTFTPADWDIPQSVTLSAVDDAVVEGDRFSTITLSVDSSVSDSAFVRLADQIVDVTILDNDVAVFLVDDVTADEDALVLNFTLSLSNPVDIPIDVDLSFIDGTAVGAFGGTGADYDNGPLTVAFAALETTPRTVSVALSNDDLVELDETFTAALAVNPTTVAGSRAIDTADTGIGTIANDDVATVRIDDVTRNENADAPAGTTEFVFTVSIDYPASHAISVVANTNGQTALGDVDFIPVVGRAITIAPGQTSAAMTVSVVGENLVELDETFSVDLAAPTFDGVLELTRAALGTARGIGTIVNDDTAEIVIDDVDQEEDVAGTTTFTYTITLSNPVDTDVILDLDTRSPDQSEIDTETGEMRDSRPREFAAAVAGTDYTPVLNRPITFAATELLQRTTVEITADADVELEDVFFVELSNLAASGRSVGILDDRGVGHIANDDLAIVVTDSSDSAADMTDVVATVDRVANNGVSTLREAILLSNAATGLQTIDLDLAGGTTIALDGTRLPSITDSVRIAAPVVDNPDQLLVVDAGRNPIGLLDVVAGVDVSLTNLHLTRSGTSAIVNSGGDVSIDTLMISDSTADGGAGIASSGGSVFVSNSTIGGPFRIERDQSGTVVRAGRTGNVATGDGGGIRLTGGADLMMVNSTISGNTAASGAAIAIDATSTATLTNVTIASNTVSTVGNAAGIHNDGMATLNNTVVANQPIHATASSSPDVAGVFVSNGRNLIGNTGTATGFAAGDITGSAAAPAMPLLTELDNHGGPTFTHLPLWPIGLVAGLTQSPLIDAGDRGAITTAGDQRGAAFPRVVGPAVDIGAVEVSEQQPGRTVIENLEVDPNSNVPRISWTTRSCDVAQQTCDPVNPELETRGLTFSVVFEPTDGSEPIRFVETDPDSSDDGVITRELPALAPGTYRVLVSAMNRDGLAGSTSYGRLLQSGATGSSVAVNGGVLSVTVPEVPRPAFAPPGLTLHSRNDVAEFLDSELGLQTTGNLHENWGGWGEKWLQSDDGRWYALLPDGGVYEWQSSRKSPGRRVATLNSSFHANPSTLFDAAGNDEDNVTGVAQRAARLDASLGLHSTGNLYENWGGRGEKWIRGMDGSWYFITPDGGFFRWDRAGRGAAGEQIDQLSPAFHGNVELLVNAAAIELDQTYGFASTGDYHRNWGGLNEKWIRGSDRTWYFITPDGSLFEWDRSGRATGRRVAGLASAVHEDPARLHDAFDAVFQMWLTLSDRL